MRAVDRIARVSAEFRRPSWLDASAVLLDVVKLYSSERSVRPGLAGVERAIPPAIKAAFARERGLVAHLHDWLDGPGRDFIASKNKGFESPCHPVVTSRL
jgi:hypothetical protein